MAVRAMMRKTRSVRIILSLLLIGIWVALDQREPFRSHFGLTLLGSGVSAIVVGGVVYLLGRRKLEEPT
jgi:multisubunit Na+/H+ antiporter MnhC subunit